MLKRKNPRGFRGARSTNHTAKALCKGWVRELKGPGEASDILAAWPEIIGSKFAPMTAAESFEAGVLKIRVKNSTLYTLFVQYEKDRLRELLQRRFPGVVDIDFKMG